MNYIYCDYCGDLIAGDGRHCCGRTYASHERDARHFWRGVTAARARYVADNGMYWRQAEHRARCAGDADEAGDCDRMAEKHERQAAWLRECAEVTS